jgi:hypothetical protein
VPGGDVLAHQRSCAQSAGPDGARYEGLIRRIGGTGHGRQIATTHRRSVDRFDFDSTLVPQNYITMQNCYYAANFDARHRACRGPNVAIQTIKPIAPDSVATSGCWSELARTSHALQHFGLFTLRG